MKLQLLVSTVDQTDYSLLEKMNIQSDAIVVNQSNKNNIEKIEYRGHIINWMSFAERGVGLSRNTALMRATGDICLFSDDDMVYTKDYKDLVKAAFEESPEADMIIFNIKSKDDLKNHYVNNKVKKLTRLNSMRYGAPRIAIKLTSLQKSNVYFSLLYGGGAPHSAGEDSLFLVDCFKEKMKVYTSPYFIGEIDDTESTWFEGYNEKYYIDRGYWLANAFPRLKYFLAVYYAYRLRHTSDMSIDSIFKLIISGIKKYDK